MPFEVLLSEQAERDIEDIYRYIAEHDDFRKADRVLAALENCCCALVDFPERGNAPKELQPLGITEFREVHDKPYRAIRRIFDTRVIVYCVLDGTRDMQKLLQRRLMR
jgi:toxin ParE1/3/4